MKITVRIERMNGVMVEEVEYQNMNKIMSWYEQLQTFNTIAEYINNKLVIAERQKKKKKKSKEVK